MSEHDKGPDNGPDDKKGPKPESVKITVNDQSVTLPDKHTTGLAIKQIAMASGVDIQLEWVLSDEREKIIPDDKSVTVKDGDDFWAVPGDDNS